MRLKLLLVLLLVSLLLPAGTARAAGGVTIGPASKEIIINPEDAEATFELTITNGDDKAITARLRAIDFKALDESGGVAFTGLQAEDTSTSYSLSSWLTFSADVVSLEPGKTAKVTAIVTNRDSLGPGGHYGAIVVTPVDIENQTDTSRVEIVPATATLVLVKKLGGEIYDLKLGDVTLDKQGLSFPDKVTLRFQNTGNVHVVPRGTVVIRDPLGNTVSKAVINSDSGIILPESFRKYPSSFTTISKAWLPGRYEVETSWRYDGKDEITTVIESFWYVGTAAYLIPLLLLLITFVLWISRRKRGKNSVND